MEIGIWNGRTTAWQKVQTVYAFMYTVHRFLYSPHSNWSTIKRQSFFCAHLNIFIRCKFDCCNIHRVLYSPHSLSLSLFIFCLFVWVTLIWSFVIHSFAFIFRLKSNSIQLNWNEKTFNTHNIKWNRKIYGYIDRNTSIRCECDFKILFFSLNSIIKITHLKYCELIFQLMELDRNPLRHSLFSLCVCVCVCIDVDRDYEQKNNWNGMCKFPCDFRPDFGRPNCFY